VPSQQRVERLAVALLRGVDQRLVVRAWSDVSS
jgi:hypothetical protein